MESIELVCRRRALGVSVADFAGVLNVPTSTVAAWEMGECVIPAGVVGEQLFGLEQRMEELVREAVAMVDAAGPGAVLIAWDDPAGLWAARPELDGLPVRLYQAAMGRAVAEVTGAAAIIS